MTTTKCKDVAGRVRKHRRSAMRSTAFQLVHDLWHFIENVPPEDPTCTDQFFALRARVRNYYAEGELQQEPKEQREHRTVTF